MKPSGEAVLMSFLRWGGGLLFLLMAFYDLSLAFEKHSLSFSEPNLVNANFMISDSNLLLRIGVVEFFLGVLWLYSFRPPKS